MAAAAPPAPAQTGAAGRSAARGAARAPWALLVALLAACFYAAIADGGTDLPQESWLQLGLVAISAAACAAWLYGGGLALSASPVAWAGAALLALFAVWTGVTMIWSVAPDRSWIELNRGISYVLVLVLALAAGSSVPRAPERLMKGIAVVVAPVALYALGGKTIPGVDLGFLDFDHAGGVTRLRAPLDYWNALALFCVFGVPPYLRLAADPAERRWVRLAGLLAVYTLVLTIGLTYSRGGFVSLLVALGVFLALTTQRVRSAVLFMAAAFVATIPLTVALTRPDLTTNALPVGRREDDAFVVLVTFVAAGVIVLGFGLLAMRLERSRRFSAARGRRVGRRLAIAAAAFFALAFLNAAATGGLAKAVDTFTAEKSGAGLTDPTRLLSTNSGNRWTWWKEAAGAWSDRPAQGWGAGSFPITHERYRTVLLPVQQPHSLPLQFLAETGIVGALLGLGGLLALLAAALARVRGMPWRLEGGGAERAAAAALLAAPFAWLVHSLYDWDWDIPGVTVPMFVALGVLAARPARRGLGASRAPALRGLGFAGIVLALVLFAVSAGLPALAETRTGSAVASIGKDQVSEAELADAASDAEVAARLNPLAVEPLIVAAAIAERRGRLDEARREILRALDRQPDSLDAWLRLARLELARLDRAGVRRAAIRALELDPLNPVVFALVRRALQASVLPAESATATGSPLPTQIPITEPGPPGAIVPPPPPAPSPTPTPFPSPTPLPTPTPATGGAPAA